MTEKQLSPTAQAAVAALRDALPPPWSVTMQDVSIGRVSVKLEHPLTSVSGVSFDDGDRSGLVINEFLAHREFKILAEAPTAIPHAQLIRRLRDAAAAHGWSADVVAVLALVLGDQDVLTDEESEWLERAGPAWVE